MVSTVETECTPSHNQCKTTKFFTTELHEYAVGINLSSFLIFCISIYVTIHVIAFY
jgi:hypothetical protein